MAITMNITKEPRKIFLSKYSESHEVKFEGKERKLQTSPEYVGGNQDQIAQSNLQGDQQSEL